MSWRLVLARRRQILLRLGRKDSTDSADRSISKVRNWSSGTRLPRGTWSVKVATTVGVRRRHDAKQPRGDWPDQPPARRVMKHKTNENVQTST